MQGEESAGAVLVDVLDIEVVQGDLLDVQACDDVAGVDRPSRAGARSALLIASGKIECPVLAPVGHDLQQYAYPAA